MFFARKYGGYYLLYFLAGLFFTASILQFSEPAEFIYFNF